MMMALIASPARHAFAADQPAAIVTLEVQRQGEQVRVVITLTQAVTPALSTAVDPARVLLDFPNTTSDARQKRLVVKSPLVQSVRYGLNQVNPPVARVVLDLKAQGRYAVTSSANTVVLAVNPAEPQRPAKVGGGAPGAGRGPWISLSRPPQNRSDYENASPAAPQGSDTRQAITSTSPSSISVSFGDAPTPESSSLAGGPAPAPRLNLGAALKPQTGLSGPHSVLSTTSATANSPQQQTERIEQHSPPAAPVSVSAEPTQQSSAPAASESPVPQGAANSDLRTVFHVKYVAQGTAYLDGGRSSGLAEGVKLFVKDATPSSSPPTGQPAPAPPQDDRGSAQSPALSERPPAVVAELHVISVADTSAVCEIVSPSRPVKPGDDAYLDSAAAEALVQQRALSSTRLYPQVITFTEGDPLDEEQREAVPRPPLPEVNRARGRIGFDYGGIRSGGASAMSSNQFGLVLRTDITRIGGTYWNLSGYWRGRLDSRGSTGQQTLQDTINRTYHLAMTYDNPNSRLVAGFGRMYLPWASSLETIDGGYVGERIAKGVTAGLFAGSTPDPTSWSYNPDRRIAGTFINFDGGAYDSWKYTSTTGMGLSTLLWRIDRPFVFFENGIFYKRYLSIYHSLQADAPRGNTQVASPGAGISRSYFTLRVQPIARVSLDFNHNYFRDIPTFDLNLVGTGLLDKVLFQGMSVGARAEVLKDIYLYTEQGRSKRSGDPRSSWNQMYGITFTDVMKTRLRADVHYSKFNSSFAQGHYEALSLSRNFRENLRWEVQAGQQAFVSPFSGDNGSKFLNMSLDANLGSRYFLQGGYTIQRGNIMNYGQWYFTLGYRFDNRINQK